MVLTECDNPGPAVDRILSSLKAATGDEALWEVRVAIGAVTIVDPGQGVDFSELFRLADEALSAVRGQGRSDCASRRMCSVPERQPASA